MAPGDLPDYSKKHLDYEIAMLVDAVRAWRPHLSHPIPNALTEAFAVHLRNLIAFLYTNPDRKLCGDVIAADFFASAGEWQSRRPDISARLKQARARAHREIAHLTVDRIPGCQKGKEWDPALVDDVMVPLNKFVEFADDDRLHPGVKARVLELAGQPKPIVVAVSSIITEVNSTVPTLPSTTPVGRLGVGRTTPTG